MLILWSVIKTGRGGYTGNLYIRVAGRRIIWRVSFIQVGNITGSVSLVFACVKYRPGENIYVHEHICM